MEWEIRDLAGLGGCLCGMGQGLRPAAAAVPLVQSESAAREAARAYRPLSDKFSQARFGSTVTGCEGKFEPAILHATDGRRHPGVTAVPFLDRYHRGAAIRIPSK